MIKIGVISDIHCHDENNSILQGGYYYASMPDLPIEKNPFSSFKKLIRKEKLVLDYILSPGDYAHQIDIKGLKSAWEQLKMICNESNAKALIGTIGNHDVSSRDIGDSFAAIKTFDIDFPVYKLGDSTKYKNQLLGNTFFTLEDSLLDILFVTINSSFDHWTKEEARKGKINSDSVKEINAIISESNRKYKIVLIHHHPIIHETGIHDTGDIIEGAEELLKQLEGIDFIVHGHKHDFRFTQFKHFPKNLNILASGSFSCYKTSLRPKVLNSFHIIELHTGEVEFCKNQGKILTFLYNPIDGWEFSEENDQGFGCILTISEVCHKIAEHLSTEVFTKKIIISWSEVTSNLVFLEYISIDMRSKVIEELKINGTIIKESYSKNHLLEDLRLR